MSYSVLRLTMMILSFILSIFLTLMIFPNWIQLLKRLNVNQSVNQYALKKYKDKAKTPIMGGVVFLLVPIVVTIVILGGFAQFQNVLPVLLAAILFGMIGFLDDYLIFSKGTNAGLSAKLKLFLQIVFSIGIVFLIYHHYQLPVAIKIPILNIHIHSRMICFLGSVFMMTGASNAVNITDGMDGLAGGCSVIALISFLMIALMTGNFAIAVFIVALLASLIGYLKYNLEPAKIYMGDTGSLALGAVFATLAIMLKQEVLLMIIGGVFVWETICVIIQIASVKIRKKRVFNYTPIHYNFVLDGLSEKSVVKSFWVLSIIFAVIGLIIFLI